MEDLLKETIKEVVQDAKKGQYVILEESLLEEDYEFIPQIIEGVKEELDEKTFKRFLTAQTNEFRTTGEEKNVESAINEFLHKYGFSEDFMFKQGLSDCQDECITVDRGDYTLHINGGAQCNCEG